MDEIKKFLYKNIAIKVWLAVLVVIATIVCLVSTKKLLDINYQKRISHNVYWVTSSHLARLAKSIKETSTVFLGSSSVQGLNVGSIVFGAVNLGIGGETIRQLSKRMASYQQLYKAKNLVFMAGFNDVCNGDDSASNMFISLLEKTKVSNIYVVGLQPAPTKTLCLGLQASIKRYNNTISRHCSQKSNCEFIDFSKDLIAQSNLEQKKLMAYFEVDGVHFDFPLYIFISSGCVWFISVLSQLQ